MNPVELCHKSGRVLRNLAYVDFGAPEDAVVLTGVPRSGTTWLGGVLQQGSGWRSIFEPLFPRYVKQSARLGYYPYSEADSDDPLLEAFLARVLAGRIRGRWVDRDNRSCIFRGRLIKEVRWNFLLGRLNAKWPHVRILLIVRKPMPVLRSWQTLGWLSNPQLALQSFALPHLLQDRRFLRAWPRLAQALQDAGKDNDPVLSFALQWYLSLAIPMAQLPAKAYRIAAFDSLTADPETLGAIFEFAKLPTPEVPFQALAKRRSSTDFGTQATTSAQRAPEPGEAALTAFARAGNLLDIATDTGAEAARYREEPLRAWSAFDSKAWASRWRG
ncbi:MAG: hypothetical protein ACFBZ8_00565 [Opitutales bacterium]